MRVYEGMRLSVSDLPQYGVVIHDSSNPAFKNELSALYSIPPDLLNDVMRYSIVVQNNTPQPINALSVIWKFYPSQGEPILKIFTYFHANQFFSDPTLNMIPPNGRLVHCLLLHSYGFAPTKSREREIKNDEQLQHQLNHLNALIARSEKWSVDLDGVLFSNGIYVGPDSAKYFDQLNARFKGARDAIDELMQKLNNNEPYANAFAHAQSYASRYADLEAQAQAQLSDMPQRMRDPAYIYDETKMQMGHQVMKRRENFGEQAAIDFIRRSSEGHIPLVKR
jgi:hypothetical protein